MQLPSKVHQRSLPVLFFLLALCLLSVMGAKAQGPAEKLPQLPAYNTITSSKTTICAGEVLTLSAVKSLHPSASYEWMVSKTAGGPYETITDKAGFKRTYTTDALTPGTYYYVLAIDHNPFFYLSNEIAVTVYERPAVTAHVTENIVYSGMPVVFYGSGASTYTWSDGVINNKPFVPASVQTYVVTGTDANGCKNTDMITVVVNQQPSAVTASIKN